MSRTLQPVWLGSIGYLDAWELQRTLAEARAADEIGDCVLLLEHPPVYTLGRNTEGRHLGGGPEALRALGAECVEVDRGGSVTFHGPGQLVAYPIVRLAPLFPMTADPAMGDVIAYVRALEAALIATAARCGVTAERREGYTGAWVGREKLAAIGVKLARGGVTQHGVALNVDTDLGWFGHVVPCGIEDGGVTSLERLGVAGETPQSLAATFTAELAAVFGLVVAEPEEELRRLLPVAGAV